MSTFFRCKTILHLNLMKIKLHEKILSFVKEYKVFFVLAIAFVPALITVVTLAYGPVENYGWNILYYHVGYETGFGGRKLLASFCHFVFPEFVTLRNIRTMVIIANFTLVLLFILFTGKSILNCRKTSVWLPVSLLYLLGPFSIVAFMTSELSVAFTETYQIVLTLVWLLLWVRYRGKWLFYIATLLVATTCCLQHHTFCCTLFPLYVGLFAYDIIGSNRLHTNKMIVYGSICFILLGILFVIWKFSQMTIGIEELNDWLKEHASVDAFEGSRQAQTAYYYQTNAENREAISEMFSWRFRYGELFWSIVLMLPLLVTVYYPWVRASHTASSKLSAWRYRLVWILITILTVPIFCMAIDYSRWFICYFFSMFAATMAVISTKDRPLSAALSRMYRWFSNHPFFSVALVLYLIGLHCTSYHEGDFGLREAIKLWSFIKGVLF